jgi:low temperature requirement protein LtrA
MTLRTGCKAPARRLPPHRTGLPPCTHVLTYLGAARTAQAALAAVDLGAGSSFLNPQAAHTAIFGAVLLLEACAPAVVTAVPSAHLPLHVEHVDERLGA